MNIWKETSWDSYYKSISPFVVKIITEKGTGTGLIAWEDDSHIHIFTALHVVDNRFLYTICFYDERLFTCPGQDAIIRAVKPSIDLAILSIPKKVIPFNDISVGDLPFPVLAVDDQIDIGTTVGWIGYPGIFTKLTAKPGFFSGSISGIGEDNSYLIDGTAISGVSGGPVISITRGPDNTIGPVIIGIITAYLYNIASMPNQDQIALPGVAVALNFKPFIQSAI